MAGRWLELQAWNEDARVTGPHRAALRLVAEVAASPEPPLELGRCEREVLAAVLEGLQSAEIATLRGRSRRTIENQLATLYRKLGVRGRLELFARFASHLRPTVVPSAGAALPVRVREAALRAAQGESNKEIAFALACSTTTAAELLAAAARRLGVGSRRELIGLLGGDAEGGRSPGSR